MTTITFLSTYIKLLLPGILFQQLDRQFLGLIGGHLHIGRKTSRITLNLLLPGRLLFGLDALTWIGIFHALL